MNWGDLGEAFALVLIIDGLMPLLFPQAWKRMILLIPKENDNNLRIYGFVIIIAGSFLLSVIRN